MRADPSGRCSMAGGSSVEGVLHVADDLLEQVFQRHQPGRAAVLVQHDGDVLAALAEGDQQVVDRHAAGDEQRFAHQVARAAGAQLILLPAAPADL